MMFLLNIIILVVFIGVTLYAISTKNSKDTLQEVYDNLCKRHDETCKQLDLARREIKVLQEENGRLDDLPKVEKIKKTPAKKTAAKKTTKK